MLLLFRIILNYHSVLSFVLSKTCLFHLRKRRWTAPVTNPTTVTELAGINIAAIIGDSCAVRAKYSPMML